jgi:hypothetical protein
MGQCEFMLGWITRWKAGRKQIKTKTNLIMANEELNSSLSIRQISRLRSSGSDKELLSGILRRRGKET